MLNVYIDMEVVMLIDNITQCYLDSPLATNNTNIVAINMG